MDNLLDELNDSYDLIDYMEELSKPYDPHDIKWRVTATSAKSNLVVPYLDARHIEERLDEVVPGKWELIFNREPLEGPGFIGGHVVYAQLIICGVSRQDVGSSFIPNLSRFTRTEAGFEKLDENKLDPKTATSDSMKRVAAQFGIGRYLWKFDKSVWIPKKDSYNTAPNYEDIDQTYHNYLYKLGVDSQFKPKNPKVDPTDIIFYLMNLIANGVTTTEDLMQLISSHHATAYDALVKRYLKDEAEAAANAEE